MTRKLTFLILAMLFAILGPGAKAWGQNPTRTWVLTSASTDWTAEGNETYFSQPYGYKKANGTLTNANIADFTTYATEGKTITSIKVGFKGLRNGTTVSKITISLVDADGNILTSGSELELTNASAASNTAYVYSTFTTGFTGATGFMMKVTTFGKNVLINEASYEIEYTEVGAPKLESIAISGTPNKTTYEAGEEFDPAGLVVTGTYDDETQAEITSGITWNVTPSGALTIGTTSVSVTATVDGKSDTKNYYVTVNAIEGDRLTLASTGVSSGYTAWTDKTGSEGVAKYAGQSSNGYSSIQMRNQSPSGIVSTTSGGLIKKVKVDWNTNTTNGRSIKIYGSNTAYTESADVYDSEKRGEELGSIAKGTTELEITGDFAYVGILPVGGAMYLNSITFVWSAPKVLEGIAVKTAPTIVNYAAGEFFNPAGLVITATYDDETTADIAYEGNEDKFSFSPALDVALATTDEQVTITYGGKSCNQDITVNLIKLATPANLQATNVTSTSATLTWDEITGASRYEVTLNGSDVKTAETNSLLVEDLTPEATYTWTVKAKGDNTTYSDSDESVERSFTTPAIPSVAYTVTFSGNGHGNPAIGSITETSAGAGITLPGCTPNTGYQFVGWATTETATEANAGEAGETYNPTEDIILYAVYNSVYTITWIVNDTPLTEGEQTTSVVEGEGITTLPTTPSDISEMKFQGWTETRIETFSTTAPTDLFTDAEHAPEITINTTFYAVFAEQSGTGETTYTKLSSNSFETSATYVLAAEESTSSSTLHYFSSYTTTTANESWGVTSTTATDAITFTLSGTASALVAQDASGNYLTPLATGKFRMSSTIQTLNLHNDGTIYNPTSGSTGYNLRYNHNNGSGGFRWYNGTTGTSAYFYKVETSEITYSNYCTTIVAKELTRISLSGEYPTEFWKGEAFSHEGMTVTAHYNDESTKDVTSSATFTGYDMAAAGEQTVTVTYDTKSTTYSITVKTIANTQENAYTVAEAIALIDDGNDLGTEVYVKGTVSAIVTEFSSDYGNITFDVSEDGQTEGQQFRFYRNFKGADNTEWASAAECPAEGDDVIGLGKLTKYGNTYELAEGNYIVSLIRFATLSIDDITVSLGGTISPEITSNVPEAERTITYSVASEDVVKVDEEGNLVTVAVGGPVVVTATLTADGYKEATTTFEVEVIKALSSIAVKTAPTNISYKAGDFFDPTGLVITATYSDTSTGDIAYAGNEDNFTFVPSLETALTTGITSVTITYADKASTTQAITVRALYTYNITWMANGEQFTTTEVTEGNALVLPETNPDNVGDMVFQGWINTENYYHAEIAPDYIVPSEIIPAADAIYYAVYAKEQKDIQETTSTMDFSEETYSDWEIDDKIVRTANQGTGGTGDFAGKINTNNTYITFNKKVKVESFGFSFKRTTTNENYNVYIETSTDDENWTVRQTYPMKDFGNGSYTTKTDDTFDGETDLYVRFHCYNTTATRYVDDVIIQYMGEDITYSNFCTTVTPIAENTTISSNTVWRGNYTTNGHIVTIEDDAVLTVNGALINSNPANLIIEDGGQLIHHNAGVAATIRKNITAYTEANSRAGYQLISIPFSGSPTPVFSTDNFLYGDYDMYMYEEETHYWLNQKDETDGFDGPVFAVGYLYANSESKTVSMPMDLTPCNELKGQYASYTPELTTLNGFNLAGNPFPCEAYLYLYNHDNDEIIPAPHLIMNAAGDGFVEKSADNPIGVGEAAFVQVDGEHTYYYMFSPENLLAEAPASLNISVSQATRSASTLNNALVCFGEGLNTEKFMLNSESTKVYIPQNGKEYGAIFAQNEGEMPVNFKAEKNGSYTITVNTENVEANYLHLIDNMTGMDTDLLSTPSYTFDAKTSDYASRFKLVFGVKNDNEEMSQASSFAYINNGEIVISNEGRATLQVIDVLGRIISSEEINGECRISTNGMPAGLYILNLNGMTQKIVVR